MASYHLSVKTIKRSAGRSATAAAAYRSGSVIACDREGRLHDYSAKRGIEASFILAPEDAPEWVRDRAALWNAAEARETRKNSVTAREWELALPAELGAEDRAALVREFASELVARYGIAVDVALHAPHREGDQRNHHAHVLTTTRTIGEKGFGDKTRVLDAAKTGGIEIEAMRGLWAGLQNRALERAGEVARVDHRSLELQRQAAQVRGDALAAEELDRAPEVKLGPAVNAMERRARREAERDGVLYAPVTERGRAVHAARQARAAWQQMRERVGQVRAAYELARDSGQSRVSAGLVALRAAAAREPGAATEAAIAGKLAGILGRGSGPAERERTLPEQQVAAPRPRNPQLLRALAQIADGVARGERIGFGREEQARAFLHDLKQAYGAGIFAQAAVGDDRALAADFPDAGMRRQLARGIAGLGRSYGAIARDGQEIGLGGRRAGDDRSVGTRISRGQDEEWEL
ncbi:MobQ family relaxase [Paracoccus sp. CPCC 101403]|uniref:MobQ family relaxase n=1 Tax=Paracoccus broussonetiae TaxID=3075834 RepID=A0ABU3EKP7_9RHOB|nr:MobQ family relaxase [Paracoccus sp. CPCC 101403]MDT1064656.1 MobQ family relaxase [Paracoccus sp. CPCC 101403]